MQGAIGWFPTLSFRYQEREKCFFSISDFPSHEKRNSTHLFQINISLIIYLCQERGKCRDTISGSVVFFRIGRSVKSDLHPLQKVQKISLFSILSHDFKMIKCPLRGRDWSKIPISPSNLVKRGPESLIDLVFNRAKGLPMVLCSNKYLSLWPAGESSYLLNSYQPPFADNSRQTYASNL